MLHKLKSMGTWLLAAALAAACVLVVSLNAARVLESRLMKERRDKIRAAVETAHGIIVQGGKMVESGEMTREEAQRRVLETVRALRYGTNDYFWIQDTGSLMLMHPFLPELEHKILIDFADPTGKLFFREFAERAASSDHAGYVSYRWPRPGAIDPVRKLSYVKLYEPWQWIIGSGTYLDDFDATMAWDASRIHGASAIVALILAGSVFGAAYSRRRTKRLETELQQSRKLEAVGQLAAGIAHEINTPIQFIGDNTHFQEEAFAAMRSLLERQAQILDGVSLPSEVREALARAAEESELPYFVEQVPKALARTNEGVRRVATIVRAMKEFAHPDQCEMSSADINRALEATLEVARNEYKYVADVEVDGSELPLILCYPGDLNQVFLNVIVNAAHAIADVVKGTQARGKIRISTRREKSEVVIAISDTGAGIPPAIRDRVFEPFFTTKEVGRGSGQGLAIARSIVHKHRGSITFVSQSGEGTTFFIRLPINGTG